jgi:hypothetical protein
LLRTHLRSLISKLLLIRPRELLSALATASLRLPACAVELLPTLAP